MDEPVGSKWKKDFFQQYSWVLGVIILFCLFKVINFQDSSSNIVTVYPVLCSKPETIPSSTHCQNPIATEPIKYRVSYSRQEVIEDGLMTRLAECAVFDVKNWSYNYSDKSANFTMVNGQFFEHATQPELNNIYYTDKLSWIKIKSGNNPIDFMLYFLFS